MIVVTMNACWTLQHFSVSGFIKCTFIPSGLKCCMAAIASTQCWSVNTAVKLFVPLTARVQDSDLDFRTCIFVFRRSLTEIRKHSRTRFIAVNCSFTKNEYLSGHINIFGLKRSICWFLNPNKINKTRLLYPQPIFRYVHIQHTLAAGEGLKSWIKSFYEI